MAIDQISSYSDSIRMSGLATGLDTESIIENLMKIEEAKVFKIEQEKTYANWEMEAYREVIDELSEFSKSQFNLLDGDKNILSTTFLKTVSSFEQSDYVSIIANGETISGNYTINEIVQLAKASSINSSSSIKGAITSSNDITVTPTLEVDGMSFYLRLDGVQEKISFTSNFATEAELVADIQNQANSVFGSGRVDISLEDGKYLSFSADNSTLQIITDTESEATLDYLGLNSGAMNILNTSSSLEDVFGTSADVQFTINDVDFTFTNDQSLDQIMDEINDSSAKVRMTYDSINDQINIVSLKSGAGSEIVITNTTGDFFGASSYINIDEGTTRNGQDATFYLNDSGKTNLISRSSNVFTIDNITYSLKEISSDEIDFSISDNQEDAYDKISSFIKDYNELLDNLYTKINEKKDYGFSPLSETQKEAMTESEVTKWETQAKQGILKSDNILYNLYRGLRESFIKSIEDADQTFFEVGIRTTDYSSNGRIEIDESKLKAALENNFENVMELFNKTSSVEYDRNLTTAELEIRFDESGFAQRINDVLKMNITTIRDESGNKGLLLEKAGLLGDASEFSNFIKTRLEQIEQKLEVANERMDSQEESYWAKFSSLEQSIQRMNEQSSWIQSQLG